SFSPIIAYPKAWSPSTDGVVRGDAVYVDAKTPADLERYRGKLRGTIVLLAPPATVPARVATDSGTLSDEDLLKLANAGPPESSGEGEMSPERRAQIELALARWRLVYSERPAVVLTPGRGQGGTIYVTDATVSGPADAPTDTWPRPWATNAG